MWALPASSLPEGKYPTYLLLGSICLSDPWTIVITLARVRQVQAGWCKLYPSVGDVMLPTARGRQGSVRNHGPRAGRGAFG